MEYGIVVDEYDRQNIVKYITRSEGKKSIRMQHVGTAYSIIWAALEDETLLALNIKYKVAYKENFDGDFLVLLEKFVFYRDKTGIKGTLRPLEFRR